MNNPSDRPKSEKMKKIFLVQRTDKVDYDEYDAFVVRANTPEEAWLLCSHMYGFSDLHIDYGQITEITSNGESEIILGSFNAG